MLRVSYITWKGIVVRKQFPINDTTIGLSIEIHHIANISPFYKNAFKQTNPSSKINDILCLILFDRIYDNITKLSLKIASSDIAINIQLHRAFTQLIYTPAFTHLLLLNIRNLQASFPWIVNCLREIRRIRAMARAKMSEIKIIFIT